MLCVHSLTFSHANTALVGIRPESDSFAYYVQRLKGKTGMNEGDAYEIEPTCRLSLCNGSMTAHYGEYAWRVAFLYTFLFSYLFFDPLAFTGRLNDYRYSLMAALVNRQPCLRHESSSRTPL